MNDTLCSVLFNRVLFKSIVIREKIFKYIYYINTILNYQKEKLIRCEHEHKLDSLVYYDFRKFYLKSLLTASSVGNLELIRFVTEHQEITNDEIDYQSILDVAVEYGQLSIVKFINELPRSDKYYFKSVIDKICRGKHPHLYMEMLQWFKDNRTEQCTRKSLEDATRKGELEVVMWLVENYSHCLSNLHRRNIVTFAAQSGNLQLVKWLVEKDIGDGSVSAIDSASQKGNLEIIKYLDGVQRAADDTTSGDDQRNYSTAMYVAMAEGHFEIVRWFNENRSAAVRYQYRVVMEEACRIGSLEMVQFIYREYEKAVVECGQAEIQPFSDKIMHFAAIYGFKDVVEFLMELEQQNKIVKQFVYMDTVSAMAKFEIFKYLFSKGIVYKLSNKSFDDFARYRDSTALEWFKRNTKLECSSHAYFNAIQFGNLENVIWIHENTTHSLESKHMDDAATRGYLDILCYLHDNGVQCSTNAIDYAYDVSIVKWLYNNRTERCTKRGIDHSITHQNIPKLKFLDQNIKDFKYTQLSKDKNSKCNYFIPKLKFIKDHSL
ncbi:hypothetical protein PPL_07672 [Heterostelium album PN500]|uniref:Ankyrin repeat protein n=1 Tax=Heterostelium pallidum (strain ATCC 26659 / Pp 5 / PN500) TaxID=670386 RepID=D3BGM0_HETP5|nr:hypothetical protein PPL_07672 [Heterostelium album PN500]EFA79254.1 hypothetical protein PPL_07672 [Heterostelium album PN500]|eukprot:XP_020431375.1 hypothetical protein PPL_07672 [Heterostelium album PN500]